LRFGSRSASPRLSAVARSLIWETGTWKRQSLCDCLNKAVNIEAIGASAQDLRDFPYPRQRSPMEPHFHFALALQSSGAAWLAAVIVVAIALAIVGPVKLKISIGNSSGKRR